MRILHTIQELRTGGAERVVVALAKGAQARGHQVAVASAEGTLVAELDVFVLPSRGENLPIAILEAMAAALPVVATRVGGVPEVVVDSVTGLLVEPEDAAGLAGALDRVASDEAFRQRLGQAGATRIVEHFDARSTARQMVELYRTLL